MLRVEDSTKFAVRTQFRLFPLPSQGTIRNKRRFTHSGRIMNLELGTSNLELPATVWLVRHAETATPTFFHGAESDVELGEHGHRQAAAAVEWFAERKPTVVVSSTMKRAVQTAAPIALGCGVPHVIEHLLHERMVGALSGKPREEGDPMWNETLAKWLAGETGFAYPGMESFDSIRDRTLPAFRRVIDSHPGGRIVIVCHGVVSKVLLLSLLRDYTAADWLKIGMAKNLSVSELVPDADAWIARELLIVPPSVLAVNATLTETGAKKTEA
jgi:probable phosphoglycerate mutase